MFDDEWLGKEDNTPLLDFLLGWMLKAGLTGKEGACTHMEMSWSGMPLCPSQLRLSSPLSRILQDPACTLSARNMAEPEVVDPRPVTHIAELAARPRVCLQVGHGRGNATPKAPSGMQPAG